MNTYPQNSFKNLCFTILSILLPAVLTLSSCQLPNGSNSKQKEQKQGVAPKYLISCEGIGEVKLSDTHETLVQKFGKNVSEHENSIYGAFTSVWYEKAEEVNVFWKEKKPPFKTIKYIEVTKLDAPYKTRDSLFLGQSLWDMIRLNDFKAIRFVNTSQVNSPGLIKSFGGGKIEKTLPCLSAVLERTEIRNVHTKEYASFIRKKEIKSSDPLLNRIDFQLVALRIYGK